MNRTTLFATPAYGREYKTEQDVILDWEAGKDFREDGGGYFSVRDLELIKRDYSVLVIIWNPWRTPITIQLRK